ncbi:MAG: hypothetical protein AB8G11_02285 [Saprospiraceae bacterium]
MKTIKNLLLTLLVTLFTITFLSAQTTYTVNSDATNGANFSSLQAAVDSASTGDTLLIAAGGYGFTTVNKSIVIIGPGFFYGANPQMGSSAAEVSGMKLDTNSAGSTIMGLKFNVNTMQGKTFSLWIKNVNTTTNSTSTVTIVRNYLGDGVSSSLQGVLNIDNSANILFSQNFINNFDIGNSVSNAIYLKNSTNINFHNNIIRSTKVIIRNVGSSSANFKQNVLHGLMSNYDLNGNGCSFTNNILYESIGSVTGAVGTTANNICTGTTFGTANGNQQNVNPNIIFAGFPTSNGQNIDQRYQLAPGSPAENAAQNGVDDCGAYGGSTPYEPSGFPAGPAIIELSVPATSSGSLMINVKARNQ